MSRDSSTRRTLPNWALVTILAVVFVGGYFAVSALLSLLF